MASKLRAQRCLLALKRDDKIKPYIFTGILMRLLTQSKASFVLNSRTKSPVNAKKHSSNGVESAGFGPFLGGQTEFFRKESP